LNQLIGAHSTGPLLEPDPDLRAGLHAGSIGLRAVDLRPGRRGSDLRRVFGLLTYAVWKYKRKRTDDGREPPQIYGSTQIELAWTITPVIIVLVLFLATARVVAAVQNPPRPKTRWK